MILIGLKSLIFRPNASKGQGFVCSFLHQWHVSYQFVKGYPLFPKDGTLPLVLSLASLTYTDVRTPQMMSLEGAHLLMVIGACGD
jgi:hypothetical protein